jgi:UDP-N-acetyl-D-mannosaminuronate dehydrogenase
MEARSQILVEELSARVGGHCLPKDPWLLKYGLDTYGSLELNPRIIVTSRQMNDSMPEHMKELIIEALNEKGISLDAANVAILGLFFLKIVMTSEIHLQNLSTRC